MIAEILCLENGAMKFSLRTESNRILWEGFIDMVVTKTWWGKLRPGVISFMKVRRVEIREEGFEDVRGLAITDDEVRLLERIFEGRKRVRVAWLWD